MSKCKRVYCVLVHVLLPNDVLAGYEPVATGLPGLKGCRNWIKNNGEDGLVYQSVAYLDEAVRIRVERVQKVHVDTVGSTPAEEYGLGYNGSDPIDEGAPDGE